MGYILNGLVLLILGLILWMVASFIEALQRIGGGPPTPMMAVVVLGILVAIGGPVVFWIILPIRNRRRRAREAE